MPQMVILETVQPQTGSTARPLQAIIESVDLWKRVLALADTSGTLWSERDCIQAGTESRDFARALQGALKRIDGGAAGKPYDPFADKGKRRVVESVIRVAALSKGVKVTRRPYGGAITVKAAAPKKKPDDEGFVFRPHG